MDVSKKLKALRDTAGLTQDDIAQQLDVSRVTVSKWESGETVPRPRNLEGLSKIFGASIAELLGEADQYHIVPTSARVPVVSTACMGGGENLEIDTDIEIPATVAEHHPKLFVVHGAGKCCNKRFPEDAALGIDPTMQPKNDDAVLVRDKNHGSYVHIFFQGSAGTVMLSADSTEDGFEDIVITPNDDGTQLLGVVVWYQAWEDVRCV